MVNPNQKNDGSLETPRRRTRASSVQESNTADQLTPGWISGSADLFKMPSSPSPLLSRPVTRRSSIYRAAKVRQSESIPVRSRRTSLFKDKLGPPPVTRRRASLFVTHGQEVKMQKRFSSSVDKNAKNSMDSGHQEILAPPDIAKIKPVKKKTSKAHESRGEKLPNKCPQNISPNKRGMQNIKQDKHGGKKRKVIHEEPSAQSILTKSTSPVHKQKVERSKVVTRVSHSQKYLSSLSPRELSSTKIPKPKKRGPHRAKHYTASSPAASSRMVEAKSAQVHQSKHEIAMSSETEQDTNREEISAKLFAISEHICTPNKISDPKSELNGMGMSSKKHKITNDNGVMENVTENKTASPSTQKTDDSMCEKLEEGFDRMSWKREENNMWSWCSII